MELDHKTMKKIMLLITFTVLLLVGLQHLGILISFGGLMLGLLSPFILGLCIAFILNVLLKVLEERVFHFLNGKKSAGWLRCRRPFCLILTLGIIVGALFILLFLIVPEFKRTLDILRAQLPYYLKDLQAWLAQGLAQLDISVASLPQININWNDLVQEATDFLRLGTTSFVNTTVSITTSIFNSFFNFIMGLVFAVYILLQKEKLSNQVKGVLLAYLPQRQSKVFIEVAALSNRIFSRFVTGQMMEALIIGILCFLGMTLFSMPYALMIASMVGVTALIPVFGAFIGTGIGAFLILMVEPAKAFWFIVFIILLQQVEGNFIYPKVVGNSVGLPGIWVMLAVLAGGNALGVLGMIVGVPLCSVIYSLLRQSTLRRLEAKSAKESITAGNQEDA